MKTAIAFALITFGGLLIGALIASLEWQVERAANFYEQHGTGSTLPDELRPKPHNGYDWATLAAGFALALMGIAGSMRSIPSRSPLVSHCPKQTP